MKRYSILVCSLIGFIAVLSFINSVKATDYFIDVDDSHFFNSTIEFLYNQNVTEGYPDGTFKPNNNLTRAEATTFIGRMLNLDGDQQTTSFTDVNESHFASGYIETASKKGFIKGYPNKSFRPNENITREDMAVILNRAFDFQTKEAPFTDMKSDSYSFDSIEALYGSGITSGYPDGTFRPQRNISRGEISAFLYESFHWEESQKQKIEEKLFEHVKKILSEIPKTISWEDRAEIEKARRMVNDIENKHDNAEFQDSDELIDLEKQLSEFKKQKSQAALETLSNDWESGTFYSKALEYEQRFSQNDYRGDLDASEDFIFLEGDQDSKTLITAPHTTYHLREDERKSAEPFTGSMVKLLHEYIGAHVIYTTREGTDANYYRDVPLKEKMAQVTDEYDIQLVLDIHGAAVNHQFDLDIGTSFDVLASEKQVNSLIHSMISHDVKKVYENHTFTATYAETIANYAYNELGVEAMQLEFNRNYRKPGSMPDNYYNALYALAEYIVLKD